MGKRPKPNTSEVLSASEIGQYTYCSYAWQLHRMGYEPESPYLKPGTQAHSKLGNKLDELETTLRASHRYATLGLILLFLSLLLILFGVIL